MHAIHWNQYVVLLNSISYYSNRLCRHKSVGGAFSLQFVIFRTVACFEKRCYNLIQFDEHKRPVGIYFPAAVRLI